MAAGHELGDHTWTHQDLAFQSALQTRRQLERGREAIERTGGVRPRLFRPPRGNLTGAAVQRATELGFDVLLWSVTRGAPGSGPGLSGRSPVAPGDAVDHLVRHDGSAHLGQLVRRRITGTVTGVEVDEDDGASSRPT